MILLLDAGNTRVKWGVLDGARGRGEGALAHDELARLADIAAQHGPFGRVVGSNVAGAAVAARIAEALRDAGAAPAWLTSSGQCCGVTNGYEQPEQLGSDRWAALIGARALHAAPCLVVNAGTATTIDVLDAEGRFRGGVILPGEQLMRRALAGNTAQLPLAPGRYTATPCNTADAIASGCLHAQAGAVERMYRLIAGQPQAACLISGGGAAPLAAALEIPHRHIENLVLKGLAVIATTSGPT